MVIGCCGAGKSTFARRLGTATGLPVEHLDRHYWLPEWTAADPDRWRSTVTALAARERWILDGNYGGTLDLRLARADTVVYLDYSTATCLWRITKRSLSYFGRARPDVPPGCRERFDPDFYRYVATFNRRRRGPLLDKLARHRPGQSVRIFQNDGEAERYLATLR